MQSGIACVPGPAAGEGNLILEQIAFACTVSSQDTGYPPEPALAQAGAGMTGNRSFPRKRESRGTYTQSQTALVGENG